VLLCDYISDLGFIRQRIKPSLRGINLVTREFIPPSQILLIVSNYVQINGYYEVPDNFAYCRYAVRKRRLLMEFNDMVFDIEYCQPFINLDWSIFNSENIAVETIPEFIRDDDLKTQLKQL